MNKVSDTISSNSVLRRHLRAKCPNKPRELYDLNPTYLLIAQISLAVVNFNLCIVGLAVLAGRTIRREIVAAKKVPPMLSETE